MALSALRWNHPPRLPTRTAALLNFRSAGGGPAAKRRSQLAAAASTRRSAALLYLFSGWPRGTIGLRRSAAPHARLFSAGLSEGRGNDEPFEALRPLAALGELAENGEAGSNGARGEDWPQDARIIPTELDKEASDSYLAYSMAVIVGRALPDVRDGLKPVHRRILFAMHELGLSSRKPFKKCARVVGEVLGKFHPHGDKAVYDALVRMAQSFSLRSPLIDGHGNFGSIDNDPAAAMRYTECRLGSLSEAMLLADIHAATVNFIPNFDESQEEPVVLPARLPNILLNGSSGIAVGMATNIPPHNLGEVVDTLVSLIRNPNATVEELMEHLPGPDFPTGGEILGDAGLLEVYRTGRGGLVVRGKADVEKMDRSGNRSAVVISEVPYRTNKARLVENIAELVNNKTLEGVSDIRDESDRSGMRIVIEVKRGASSAVVLNNLFKYTTLQSRFSCNMVGIVNGEPMTMGLKDILQYFLDFRCSVIERRAKFHLKRSQEREHLLQGLLIGLQNLDKVLSIIRGEKDSHAASETLQREFGVSSSQSDALLAMPLRRLTSLERRKILDEQTLLNSEIVELQQLLESRQRLLQVVEKEALVLKREFGTPRLTVLKGGDGEGEINEADVIDNVETLVTLSEKGYIKRMTPESFSPQNRGTSGKSGGRLRNDDALSRSFACKAHDYVLFFSERGIVYSIRAYQIPESSRIAAGVPLVQIFQLPNQDRITSVLPVSDFAEDQYLVMLTTAGFIKRTALSSFSAIRPTGIVAVHLGEGDELRWVRQAVGDDEVVITSKAGMLVRVSCNNDKLRARGRATRGVRAMKLRQGDKIAAMDIITTSLLQENVSAELKFPCLLFVSKNGFAKLVPISVFRSSNLGRMGVIGCKLNKDDSVASLYFVGSGAASESGQFEEQQVMVGSHQGNLNRLRVRDISIQGRTAKGVRLMKLDGGDEVNTVSLLSGTDEADESTSEPAKDLVAA